ncbi:MAG: hypothetical protein JXL80_01995 [Planctomycetes bacterium]|nr:hypothetical protein [Planctomycetota bacterium]
MMTGKHIAIVVTGIALAICAVVTGLTLATAWRQSHGRPDDAESVERVTGYVLPEWEDTGFFTVRYVEGFGAYINEYRWSKAGSQYRHYQDFPGQPVPEWSAPVAVGAEGETALRNVLNLIVRDRLWTQKDLRRDEPVVDGGSATYEFSLGPHQGRFALINVSFPEAPHLKAFILDSARWTEAVRTRATAIEQGSMTGPQCPVKRTSDSLCGSTDTEPVPLPQ